MGIQGDFDLMREGLLTLLIMLILNNVWAVGAVDINSPKSVRIQGGRALGSSTS